MNYYTKRRIKRYLAILFWMALGGAITLMTLPFFPDWAKDWIAQEPLGNVVDESLLSLETASKESNARSIVEQHYDAMKFQDREVLELLATSGAYNVANRLEMGPVLSETTIESARCDQKSCKVRAFMAYNLFGTKYSGYELFTLVEQQEDGELLITDID